MRGPSKFRPHEAPRAPPALLYPGPIPGSGLSAAFGVRHPLGPSNGLRAGHSLALLPLAMTAEPQALLPCASGGVLSGGRGGGEVRRKKVGQRRVTPRRCRQENPRNRLVQRRRHGSAMAHAGLCRRSPGVKREGGGPWWARLPLAAPALYHSFRVGGGGAGDYRRLLLCVAGANRCEIDAWQAEEICPAVGETK